MIQNFIYLVRIEKDEICLSFNYMLRILDRRKWLNVFLQIAYQDLVNLHLPQFISQHEMSDFYLMSKLF